MVGVYGQRKLFKFLPTRLAKRCRTVNLQNTSIGCFWSKLPKVYRYNNVDLSKRNVRDKKLTPV